MYIELCSMYITCTLCSCRSTLASLRFKERSWLGECITPSEGSRGESLGRNVSSGEAVSNFTCLVKETRGENTGRIPIEEAL